MKNNPHPRPPEGARWKIPGWDPFAAEEAERLKPYVEKITALEAVEKLFLELLAPPDTPPINLLLEFPGSADLRVSQYTLERWVSEGLYVGDGTIRFNADANAKTAFRRLVVPDFGDFNNVKITEVLCRPGDSIQKGQGLAVIESDKASMELPATMAGTVDELLVKVGDRVSFGDIIGTLKPEANAPAQSGAPKGKIFRQGEPLCFLRARDQINVANFMAAPFDLYLVSSTVVEGDTVANNAIVAKVQRFLRPTATYRLKAGFDSHVEQAVQYANQRLEDQHGKARAIQDTKLTVLDAENSRLKSISRMARYAKGVSLIAVILLTMVVLLFLEYQTSAVAVPCVVLSAIVIFQIWQWRRRRRR